MTKQREWEKEKTKRKYLHDLESGKDLVQSEAEL